MCEMNLSSHVKKRLCIKFGSHFVAIYIWYIKKKSVAGRDGASTIREERQPSRTGVSALEAINLHTSMTTKSHLTRSSEGALVATQRTCSPSFHFTLAFPGTSSFQICRQRRFCTNREERQPSRTGVSALEAINLHTSMTTKSHLTRSSEGALVATQRTCSPSFHFTLAFPGTSSFQICRQRRFCTNREETQPSRTGVSALEATNAQL